MKNDFSLCPKCGSKKIQNQGDRKWFCQDCGFILHNNVAAAVGAIICDKNKNVLFEVRAKDPRKGFLALPGGFVDADETLEEAIIRECKEEIGTEIESPEFLCSYPNTYEYKGIVYKTCDVFFIVRLPENQSLEDLVSKLSIQESEVQKLVISKVERKEDVEKLPMAFESSIKTLLKFTDLTADM
ncbi:MAG: NUDIX domain-containing protein [Treponema sp.]|nr:NUDIX domain-containing protein [Treponema sp.]